MLKKKRVISPYKIINSIQEFYLIGYKHNENALKTYRIDRMTSLKILADDMYKVGLQKYHYINFKDNFNIDMEEIEKNGKSRILATSCRDVIEEYLSNNQHIDVNIKENPRIVIK